MFKIIKGGEIPKRKRQSVPRFQLTPEWAQMKSKLDRGLNPEEQILVTLTEEEKAKYRIKDRKTIMRFIRRYLRQNNFKYNFKTFNRDGADWFVIYEDRPLVKAKRRA